VNSPLLVAAWLTTIPAEPVDPTITIELPGGDKPGSSIVMLLALSVLAVAPSLMLLTTAFTKIIVVLSLTRNALGLTSVPPNQVLAGLALFLSLFVMAPVITEINAIALQPYLEGVLPFGQAFDLGVGPLREFMLTNTRKDELALMVNLSGSERPEGPADVGLTTLIPAFVLSELRAAFIIGFVIFLPFLVIDMVISSFLMSIGTVMLPPVMISLPFKLLLFVLVDGWGLIVTALVGSYG
jgi:flagellar biosynthesis protein FliP